MTTSIAPDRISDLAADDGPHTDGPHTVVTLARQLPPDAVLDEDEVIAAIESLGIGDRTARERYGMPSVFSLGDAVLTHLRYGRAALRPRHGVRRAPARSRYLVAALLRCALYLGPIGVAVAAGGPLTLVPWQVPAAALLVGWAAAQALAGLGAAVSRRAGPGPAVRLLAAGFGATGGLWCALVWVAPTSVIGPERLLAAVIGVGAVASLGTVTAALVTRCETAVVRWSLPIWLLAAVTVADGWSAGVPTTALLPAAILLAASRAYRPVISRPVPRAAALATADLRRAGSYLVIGAAQAGCVILLRHTGAGGTPPPAMLPLLAAVPVLEALVGWHAAQLDAGLDTFDSEPAYARHVREVTAVTVAGLLPPLAVGTALAVAAYRLPYGLSGATGAREVVLALAGGTLLGGVFAATLLLAARGRTASAAGLAAAPLLLTLAAGAAPVLGPAGTWLPVTATGTPDLLPIAVILLAVTHLAGLLAVALTALDHRRTS
jgi:hypothetical protein